MSVERRTLRALEEQLPPELLPLAALEAAERLPDVLAEGDRVEGLDDVTPVASAVMKTTGILVVAGLSWSRRATS